MELVPPDPHVRPFLRVLTLLAFVLIIAASSFLGSYWYINSQIANLHQKESTKSVKLKLQEETNKIDDVLPSRAVDNIDTTNWHTYDSKLGYSLKYPSTWNLITFEDDSSVVYLRYQLNNGDYLCIDFRITDNNFKLQNGEYYIWLHYPEDGPILYQFRHKPMYTGENEWVRLYLVNKDFSWIKLSGGGKLEASSMYNCTGGDVERLKITYDQQIKSPEYNYMLAIFKTVNLK